MASPVLVIAAGSAATTWNYLSESKATTYYPQGDFRISDVTWNHNGQVLASCSTVNTDERQHDNVVLIESSTGAKLDTLQHNKSWTRQGGATTSIAFGGKSRYLCLGDTSGAVCLWDLKKRMRVRQFSHDGEPSRQVSLDPSDKVVLSLSEQLFSIYNLREGSLAATLLPQGDYSYSRFGISQIEPHQLALGTRDGSILLYDINRCISSDHRTTQPFFTLNHRHSGSISGIAIPSSNPKLLGSSSYDGTLRFFDTRSGQKIHQVATLDSAITSLSVHADGISSAIGTRAGEVLVFDLRKQLPVASLAVPESVTTVQYALPHKSKGGIPAQNQESTNKNSAGSLLYQEQQGQVDIRPQESNGWGHRAEASNNPDLQAAQQKPASPQKSFQTFGTDEALRGPTVEDKPISRQEVHNQPQTRKSDDFIPQKAHNGIGMGEIRDVVRDEVDNLRDDVEESIRNLHMDMIRQFHHQSQEINNILSTNLATIERLTEENRSLREELDSIKGRK